MSSDYPKKSAQDIDEARARVAGVVQKLQQFKSKVGLQPDVKHQSTIRENLKAFKAKVAKFRENLVDSENPEVSVRGTSEAEVAPAVQTRPFHDDFRPLIDRIGGKDVLHHVVEMLFSKLQRDDRLRSFFEKRSLKFASLRCRVFEYLYSVFGSGDTKHESIRNAHSPLNITNFHFDVFMSLFKESLKEAGVPHRDVPACLRALRSSRACITGGFALRSALSQRSSSTLSLYDRIGEGKMDAMIESLVSRVSSDPRTKGFFTAANMELFRTGLKMYLIELLDGPKLYKGRDLEEVHSRLGLSDYHFDCFLQCAEKAMLVAAIEDSLVDEVVVRLENLRHLVLAPPGQALSAPLKVGSQSLLEALGGGCGVKHFVEELVTLLCEDSRVCYFFNRSEQACRVKQVSRLICLLAAGKGQSEVADLSYTHYNFNITDHHFDAFLENATSLCDSMKIPPSVSAQLLELLRRLRVYVTQGSTVRLEMARNKVERDGNKGLFEQMGGDLGIQRFLEEMYFIIQRDQRILHFFQGSKIEMLKRQQSKFIASLLGSSLVYQGRPLKRIHAANQISDFHFDSFVEDTTKALKRVADAARAPGMVDEFVVLLESCRSDIVSVVPSPEQVGMSKDHVEATLSARLGGLDFFVEMVQRLFGQLVADSRTRSFFERSQRKSTVRSFSWSRSRAKRIICRYLRCFQRNQMKENFALFLHSLAGGPSSTEMVKLRPLHYALNITDFHFDALIDAVELSLNQMKVAEVLSEELLRLLQSVRADVTVGCTVRMEVARRNMRMSSESLYYRLGGHGGIKGIVSRLYKIVVADGRISSFFRGKVEQIKAAQTVFISEVFGGPKVYKGQDLLGIHHKLGINDYHFDLFLANIGTAMKEANLCDSLIDEVLITLEPVRSEVVGFSRGVEENSRFKVKKGLDLVQRLGGEANVESVVDVLYDRLLSDSRARAFFHRPPEDMRMLRRKIFHKVLSVFGGPSLPSSDAGRMKMVHSQMNIQDRQFNAFLECFQDACRECDCKRSAMDDAVALLNKMRADVTTGCTVRMELARKRNLQFGYDQLFDRLRKKSGLYEVVVEFYGIIMEDPRVQIFFEGGKTAYLRSSLLEYLTMIFGGPADYRGRSLEEAHLTLTINDYHFDVFLLDFQAALRKNQHEEETIDECIVVLEQLRNNVLYGLHSKTSSPLRGMSL